MTTARHLGVLAVVLVCSTAPTAQPQSPGSGVGPVTLTLRLAHGRRQFRPGEVIPIELEFSSTIPKRFVVDGATSDRSGRLHIDEFDLEPADAAVDPLVDYFASAGGFIGGGIRGMHVLGEKPATVALELNEWFRIDSPGTYTLSVRSRRVTDETRRRDDGAAVIVPVRSNSVTFEIRPRDPDWEADELAAAMRTLDPNPRDPDGRRACRIIRFLGTDAAIDEMIRRFDHQECGFQFMAGLYGAPNREGVLARLEQRLADPDQAVDSNYLRTLAVLSILRRYPELRGMQTRETEGTPVRPAGLASRQELVKAEMAAYQDLLASALPAKSGRARAVALLTVLETPRALDERARDALAGLFRELPRERQEALLRYNWRTAGSAKLAPVLLELATTSRQADPALSDIALRRLSELEPDRARPLILGAIGNPPPQATLETLGSLPGGELPQLDDVLARNIEPDAEHDALSIRAELLHRYASPAVSARVHSSVAPRLPDMACRPKAALLAYFLRADPQLGARLLDEALATRTATGCFRMLLRSIARLRMTAALEAAALAHIDDPDAELAANAIAALGELGSPAARDPLRRRFERWQQQWKGQPGELEYSLVEKRPHTAQGAVEFALLAALGKAGSWVTGPEELRELQAWCVSENCRRQAGHLIDAAQDPAVRIFRFDGAGDCTCSVGQYDLQSVKALEQKLTQYPPGTPFGLDLSPLDPKSAAIVSDRIRQVAARQGLAIR